MAAVRIFAVVMDVIVNQRSKNFLATCFMQDIMDITEACEPRIETCKQRKIIVQQYRKINKENNQGQHENPMHRSYFSVFRMLMVMQMFFRRHIV